MFPKHSQKEMRLPESFLAIDVIINNGSNFLLPSTNTH